MNEIFVTWIWTDSVVLYHPVMITDMFEFVCHVFNRLSLRRVMKIQPKYFKYNLIFWHFMLLAVSVELFTKMSSGKRPKMLRFLALDAISSSPQLSKIAVNMCNNSVQLKRNFIYIINVQNDHLWWVQRLVGLFKSNNHHLNIFVACSKFNKIQNNKSKRFQIKSNAIPFQFFPRLSTMPDLKTKN